MAFVKCNFCNKQYSDKLTICPFCKKGAIEDMPQVTHLVPKVEHEKPQQVSPEPDQQSATDYPQPKKKPLLNIIIVYSVVVALGISFVGFKVYQGFEKKNAQKQFSEMVGSVIGNLFILASKSEDIVDETNKAWREAIFSEYRKRDFNIAISEVRLRRASEISGIKQLSERVASDIKKMNPPEVKERDYQRLKEIYLLFNKYADMAVSPSGSLQTYSQQNSELTVEIKSAIKELELMK